MSGGIYGTYQIADVQMFGHQSARVLLPTYAWFDVLVERLTVEVGGRVVKNTTHMIYRVSHELRSLLRESVPYVKIYRYNPKHLYPKLNGYGDNGQRKVWISCISAYCTSTAVSRIDLDRAMQ